MDGKNTPESESVDDKVISKTPWGNKILDGNEERVAMALEVIAGIYGAKWVFGPALASLKETLYNARHAYLTVSDYVKGGPEGMRSVQNLEEVLRDEAISVLEKMKHRDGKANEALEELQMVVEKRKQSVTELGNIYRENENVARVCNRLRVHLKGALKNFYEINNDIKPSWWKQNVDGPLIDLWGTIQEYSGNKEWQNMTREQKIKKALEESKEFREFYQDARKFSDARRLNENTVRQFCDYLSKTETKLTEQNDAIDAILERFSEIMVETYGKEDRIFETDRKGTDMAREEAARVKEDVKEYEANVAETRQQASQQVPMRPYSEPAYIDVLTNPVIVGAAAVLLFKGLTKLTVPKCIGNAVSKGICYPLKLAGNYANLLYSKIYDRLSKKGEDKK